MEDGKINISYEALWKAIVRPPRSSYYKNELCPAKFTFKGREYVRTDYQLLNTHGQVLQACFIQPEKKNRPFDTMPVVIYLHGNSSSMIEGLSCASILLPKNINLFIFDFAGSGNSEGEYIGLGWTEKDDLGIVVDFLAKLPGVGKIGLWGRSMGAATIMLYPAKFKGSFDSRIKACVIDSPFADLKTEAKEVCCNVYKGIQQWMVDFAWIFVKKTILTKAKLDIDNIKPIDYVDKITVPGMFIHAMKDELIPLEQTLKLFDLYGGEKSLNVCEGGHNTARDDQVILKIGDFFAKYLL